MAIERIVTPKVGQNNKVLLIAKDIELGDVKVDDVKVDGVSVVINKSANIVLTHKQDKLPNSPIAGKVLKASNTTGGIEWGEAGFPPDNITIDLNDDKQLKVKTGSIGYSQLDSSMITVSLPIEDPSTTKLTAESAVVNGLAQKQDKTTAVTHSANTAVGGTTTPVYINANGVATALNYTIQTSVPSGAVFTDTKNTAGSTDTSSKIFLIGAISQATNPQTYSDDEVFVTNGALTAKSATVNDLTVSSNMTAAASTISSLSSLPISGISFRTFTGSIAGNSATWKIICFDSVYMAISTSDASMVYTSNDKTNWYHVYGAWK